MGVVLFFIDGVGIGAADPAVNPFAAIEAEALGVLWGREPWDGAAFRPLDSTLGVDGLPQSATGQTTLFTGVNAARHAGRHMTGLPGPSLRPLIEAHSLFLRLVRAGLDPTFANAYTAAHLEAARPRWSVTTRLVIASGVPFRMVGEHDVRDRALYHDYTGEWFHRRAIPTVRRDAAQAAEVLCSLASDHDLVLYEYFLTDLAAHRGTDEERLLHAGRVEVLARELSERLVVLGHTLVVVSDHGNLEDGSHVMHTRNPAPLLAWGPLAAELVERTPAMDELTPALVELLG